MTSMEASAKTLHHSRLRFESNQVERKGKKKSRRKPVDWSPTPPNLGRRPTFPIDDRLYWQRKKKRKKNPYRAKMQMEKAAEQQNIFLFIFLSNCLELRGGLSTRLLASHGMLDVMPNRNWLNHDVSSRRVLYNNGGRGMKTRHPPKDMGRDEKCCMDVVVGVSQWQDGDTHTHTHTHWDAG